MPSDLAVGDVVETIRQETDIEIIPTKTQVTLTYQNGNDLWYGTASLYGNQRSVLVTTSNLRKINKDETEVAD